MQSYSFRWDVIPRNFGFLVDGPIVILEAVRDRSSFVGWVELLSLLEQCLDDQTTNTHEGDTTT